jgi:hypothetical protein
MSKRIEERMNVAGAMTAESRVDAANYVLHGVVLCGFESANGRRYPRKVLEAECGKYDGAKVFLNHSKDGRLFHEWVGVVRRPKPGSDGRPRGDIHLFKTEPVNATVIEKAQECPDKFGMSHVVRARTRREGAIDVIEGFDVVESVDIVTDPATTPGGLFEGKAVAKIPFRKLLESVLPKLAPDRAKAVHGVLAEDDAAMAPMLDAPVDEPGPDADGDDAMDDAFKQLMHTSMDKLLDESHSLSEFLKNIRAIYKTRAQVTGNGKATDDAGDDAGAKESKELVKAADVLAECALAKFSPTYDQGERLRGIPDKDTRAVVIESFKSAAAIQVAEVPRSTGRKPPVKESTAAETVPPSIDELKKRIKG